MKITPESGATPPRVNPFLEADLAARYEQWYSGPGRQADLLEKRLLQRMLQQLGEVRTILEVGCGTGHFTRWLRSLSFETTGLPCRIAVGSDQPTEPARLGLSPVRKPDLAVCPLLHAFRTDGNGPREYREAHGQHIMADNIVARVLVR